MFLSLRKIFHKVRQETKIRLEYENSSSFKGESCEEVDVHS